MRCVGCGNETSMCVGCSEAWNCSTPVCVDCAQEARRRAAEAEAAFRDVRLRDRLWNIWYRVSSALSARLGVRPVDLPPREIDRTPNHGRWCE